MIEINGVTKLFGEKRALDNISFKVDDGSIFGLIGSNGAGKSTLLRILSGVFNIEGGEALLDGEKPFENQGVKEKTAFVSDFPYFFSGSTMQSMANYYKGIYPSWDVARYEKLTSTFPIDKNQKLATMSKGMQRQVAIILALSYNPKYILFDEIFDGLDPVIRELVKKILIEYIDETGSTIIIASHNLRELEGFCDHIGLVHNGGILLERDIDGDAIGLYRMQFIMDEADYQEIRPTLNITKESRQGRIIEITVKGEQEQIESIIAGKNPTFCEMLPLTLEELFISEMEVAGYDINSFKA